MATTKKSNFEVVLPEENGMPRFWPASYFSWFFPIGSCAMGSCLPPNFNIVPAPLSRHFVKCRISPDAYDIHNAAEVLQIAPRVQTTHVSLSSSSFLIYRRNGFQETLEYISFSASQDVFHLIFHTLCRVIVDIHLHNFSRYWQVPWNVGKYKPIIHQELKTFQQ